ncbi:MAG: hypothetical protein IKP26_09140 [Clostridia bacterium]|nr:hypothetical protein [Clostridia bacterium]
MIKVLYGGRGEGMSRELCDMANRCLQSAKGSIVFIDKDDNHIYDLNREIRFINAKDYHIEGPKMFSGFVAGILAQDHDIEVIYVASFMKTVRHPISSLEGLFGFFEEFSREYSMDFVIEVNTDEECPEFIKKFVN